MHKSTPLARAASSTSGLVAVMAKVDRLTCADSELGGRRHVGMGKMMPTARRRGVEGPRKNGVLLVPRRDGVASPPPPVMAPAANAMAPLWRSGGSLIGGCALRFLTAEYDGWVVGAGGDSTRPIALALLLVNWSTDPSH
jgi:hypothetical protein